MSFFSDIESAVVDAFKRSNNTALIEATAKEVGKDEFHLIAQLVHDEWFNHSLTGDEKKAKIHADIQAAEDGAIAALKKVEPYLINLAIEVAVAVLKPLLPAAVSSFI